jgi:GNAT superfamily N-acetyltransferase
MQLTIKPLAPDLFPAYLDFFDNRAFSKTDVNGPCYCTCPTQTSEEIDRMVSEFAGDIKGTLRKYAAKMLAEGKIRGYLAFDGETVVGWCNAAKKETYVKNRYQFIPDFAWDGDSDAVMAIVCFSIAPDYRGKGVSTALLTRVIEDAIAAGYSAVEGYAHLRKGEGEFDFKGPEKLFAKLGFTLAAEKNGVAVMRITL